MKRALFRLSDIFIYIIILSFCSIFLILNISNHQGELFLHVSSSSHEYIYPLFKKGVYRFQGPVGETVVLCDETGAKIISSDCKSGSCMTGDSISKNGEWRACLPNKLFINVEGVQKEAVVDDTLY